ncbi:MAG: PD-(D/E)XK nuclease family protein [Muribaculaceae bacterium]|nr:PD-(D/E)XK nuclease family protein [Muribaculaceae bacterium]
MEPILKTLAREYSRRYPSLSAVCFLFPNKRCGIFFKKYLAEFGVTSDSLPHILTISEFMQQVADFREAGKILQLFTLYKAYLDISENIQLDSLNPPSDFEDFRGWGETILADFNTVDMALADPSQIFKNLKDFREISSNFLSDEQKEVMREYFGVEDSSDSSGFWKLFDDPDNLSPLKKNFVNLWQILAPLHDKFLESLSRHNVLSSGAIYRRAANRILERGRDALPYLKVVAAGFNALTEAERVIFKTLRDEEGYPGFDEFIDFVWDATGPILNGDNFTASRFVDYNRKHFPSPSWLLPSLEAHAVTRWPEIEIISSPSNTAQTKIAAEILQKYSQPPLRQLALDAEVALVVPDESLLSNMLYSIPDSLDVVNLTMGLSMKQTSIAAFVYLLRRLYSTLRQSKEQSYFYVKDLRMLFSHPYSYKIFAPSAIESLMERVDRFHKVSISFTELSEDFKEDSSLLLFPPKEGKGIEIFAFMREIFSRLSEALKNEGETALEDAAELDVYSQYLDDLQKSLEAFEIRMPPLAILSLADRIIAAEKIGFEGEPLSGLQVMGTLETRALDFRHVIILSMNEGMMPRKASLSTFIPEALRKAYGLPPARYAEEIFGYYFFRLLSRAEKVSLIYDGRAITGLRSGQSRYLLQIKEYAPKDHLTISSWRYPLQNTPLSQVEVAKSPEIRNLLLPFMADDDSRKNLSSSSLNTYRECQVKFFLQNVLNINSDPPRGEYMDAITVGNILHEVMMELYIPDTKLQHRLLSTPITITPQTLQNILDNPDKIQTLTRDKIAKLYYGLTSTEDLNLPSESGVTDLLASQIEQLVKDIISYDISLAPFRLYGCEISRNIRVTLSSGRVVNFRFAIDRLDEITIDGQPRLRIIDYKTGSRKRYATSLQDVFAGGFGSEQIFQLFIYAWLLGKVGFPGWEEVITEIYFVPDLIAGKGGLPEIDSEPVTSFRPFLSEFNERLEALLESIFTDPSFLPPSDSSNRKSPCPLCPFLSLCHP